MQHLSRHHMESEHFAQKGLSAWQQRQEFSRDEAKEVEKGVENSEVWPCDNSGDVKRKKDLKTQ